MNLSNNWLRIGLVSAIGLFWNQIAFCQGTTGPAISTTVDRQHVQVADPFEFSITVVAQNGVPVEFTEADTIGPFEIVSVSDQFDIPSEFGRSWKRVYRLESLESGEHEIPSQTILAGDQSLLTQPIAVTVVSSIAEDADPLQPQPLKPAIEIQFSNPGPNWGAPLLIATVLLTAVALLIRFARQPKPLSSQRWAMRRLNEIKQSPEFQQRRSESVIPQLADLVREFIHRRFGVAAPNLTTDEFLQRTRVDSRLSSLQKNELNEFLSEGDQIKFANLLPTDDRIDVAIRRVIDFVEASSDRKQLSGGTA